LGLGLLRECGAGDEHESGGETGDGQAVTAGMKERWQFNLAQGWVWGEVRQRITRRNGSTLVTTF
jgi:hypothetical protein